MAMERPNKNPYSAFNFVVSINGDTVAAFQEVSGLDSENTPIEYREGGDALNSVRKPLNGSKVLVAGIAYKKDVDDMRESPAVHLIEMYQKRGALVVYHDPFVPRMPKMRQHHLDMVSVPLTNQALEDSDCVVIATDHSTIDYARVVAKAPLVVDTRNATKGLESPKIVRC